MRRRFRDEWEDGEACLAIAGERDRPDDISLARRSCLDSLGREEEAVGG